MISKKLLAGVLLALAIVCFISAPVLCGSGDEDPWDVDNADPGGYSDPSGGGDSSEVVYEFDGSGDSRGGISQFQSTILRYSYSAWVLVYTLMDQSPVTNQTVAGKADGGTVATK